MTLRYPRIAEVTPVQLLQSDPRLFFHHKSPVCTITDLPSAARDNDDRIEESRRVYVSQDGPQNSPQSHFGKLFDNKRSEIALSRLFSKTLAVSPLESKTGLEFSA
jgi:hypothetical protein